MEGNTTVTLTARELNMLLIALERLDVQPHDHAEAMALWDKLFDERVAQAKFEPIDRAIADLKEGE